MRNLLALATALVALVGCIDIPTNIRGPDPRWGGYSPDTTYILERDVFLQWGSDGFEGRRLILIAAREDHHGRGRIHSSPESIDAWRADPEGAVRGTGARVVGVVERGTLLRTTRVKSHWGVNLYSLTHEQLSPYAEIRNGEFAGEEVDLGDVSWNYWEKDATGENVGPTLVRPTRDLLVPVL